MSDAEASRTQPQAQQRAASKEQLAVAVQARLAAEILRKLSLAAEAEHMADRDIVCAEVFADITGELNSAAQASAGLLYSRWYEALAPYFCRNWGASEALLAACRRLWGQPFTAPTYTLLLHQWLLTHADAGGRDQRQKLLAVLVSGARQLFLGDVETGGLAFQPLYSFLTEQVVLGPDRRRLAALPSPARESIVTLAAAFLPYYSASSKDTLAALDQFPSPFGAPSPAEAAAAAAAGRGGGAAGQGRTAGAGGAPAGAGEGADFAVSCMADVLGKDIRTEAALLRYLQTLAAWRGAAVLGRLRTVTRLRLQHVVHMLAQSGGPPYVTRAVNLQAVAVLDALFPSGRRTRRLISLAFRLLTPHEWLWLPLWRRLAQGGRRLLGAAGGFSVRLAGKCRRVLGAVGAFFLGLPAKCRSVFARKRHVKRD